MFETLYIFVVITWGIYCARQSYHKHETSGRKQLLVFLMNSILCPLTIVMMTVGEEFDNSWGQ